MAPPEPEPLTGNAYAHYMRGRLAAIEGDRKRAVLEFGRAAQSAPDEPEIVVAYVEALTDDRRADDATAIALRAGKRWPKRPDVALATGRALRRARQLNLAIIWLERARTLDPTNTETSLELGAALVSAEKPARAADVYRGLVEAEPEATKPRLHLARLLLDSGKPNDARPVIEDLLSIKPRHTKARLLHSRVLIALGDEKAATETLHAGFVKSGKSMRHARKVFGALMEAGEHQRASRFALRLDDPSLSPDSRAAIGRLLLRLGQPGRALEIAERTRKAAPKSLEAALLAGSALAGLRRFDEAARAARSVPLTPYSRIVAAEWLTLAGRRAEAQRLAGELEDGNTQRHYIVARIHELSGDRNRARRTFGDAIKRWPDDIDLTFEAASFELRSGDSARAIELAKPLLSADPDDASIANFVGYALAEAGVELGRADELLRIALNEHPNDANVLDSYGWLLFKQRRLSDAAQTLRRAWRMAPAEPEILFHLASVENALGRSAAAKKRYLEAYRLAIEPSLRSKIKSHIDGFKQAHR